MEIPKGTVEKMASLSKIALAADEAARLERELVSILEFIGQLNAIDTTGVLPATGGTNLENVVRTDDSAASFNADAPKSLLDASSEQREGYVRVPAVFDRKS